MWYFTSAPEVVAIFTSITRKLKITHQYLDLENMPKIYSQKRSFLSFGYFRSVSSGRLAGVNQEEEDGETVGSAYLTLTANAIFFHPVLIVFPPNPFIICASLLPEACLQLVYLTEEVKERQVGIETVATKQIPNTA